MVRFFQFFCGIYYISTIISCNGMELKSVTNARYAKYLTNNRIIVSSENGCSIINPTTDTNLKQISNSPFPHIALHPHITKFALSDHDSIILYDAQTAEPKWILKEELLHSPISSVICPFEDTVFVNYANIGAITKHTRYSGTVSYFTISPIFSFSPTQPLKCTALNAQYSANGVYIHDYNMSQEKILLCTTDNLDFCQYSPNGSIIASGNQKRIYILDPAIKNNNRPYIKHKKNDSFEIIAFHPNSLVLATLAKPYSMLHYWDIATQKLISSSSLSSDKNCSNYDLSFSPDGTKIVVTLSKKCIVLPVPFEVIYTSITKENTIFIYWLLKYNLLPPDIIQLIINIILTTYKR